ncbi:MAG TPA: CAP domain-containing protein, partial [Solirubrobacteraceae bacterium]|nr:CAP domain-containing protein [Solirubrobacteraceae bacterium]
LAYRFGLNLAWGTETGASPASIVSAWMASPPHRAIMLDPSYRDVGSAALAAVPAVKSQRPGGTYAMEFGARQRH